MKKIRLIKHIKTIGFICFTLIVLPSFQKIKTVKESVPAAKYNLIFIDLAKTWDEAMPLGNGILGALVWQKSNKLRFSLDRADLWDLRPMDNLDKPEWTFKWVQEQWQNNTYQKVQKLFDEPYDKNAGPSKIPAGALAFDIAALGEVASVELLLDKAICEVKWKNRRAFTSVCSCTKSCGLVSFFRF